MFTSKSNSHEWHKHNGLISTGNENLKWNHRESPVQSSATTGGRGEPGSCRCHPPSFAVLTVGRLAPNSTNRNLKLRECCVSSNHILGPISSKAILTIGAWYLSPVDEIKAIKIIKLAVKMYKYIFVWIFLLI